MATTETQKLFLDEDGLIELLQSIERLDSGNIKDFYWSTDNNVTNPTIVFKVGDKVIGTNTHTGYTTKEITFKGDISTAPTGATTRYITLTIDGVDKTIPYYYTNKLESSDVGYSHTNDSNTASDATTVKAALDRVITKLNNLKSTDVKMNAAISDLNITTSDTVLSAFGKVGTSIKNLEDKTANLTATAFDGTATNANNFKGTVTVESEEGTDITGPIIKVKLSGMTTASSSGAINSAATNKYGVVKLGTTSSTDTTDVATVSVVKELISNTTKSQFVIPSDGKLPELAIPTGTVPYPNSDYNGKIYLIQDTDRADENPNIFKEYVMVRIANHSGVAEDIWELLGDTDTSIDASAITTARITALWNEYVLNNQ